MIWTAARLASVLPLKPWDVAPRDRAWVDTAQRMVAAYGAEAALERLNANIRDGLAWRTYPLATAA